MSFLRIGDRAAGAIKSGGTTRRAAKMVTVDVDRIIEAYVDWKVVEEQKVAALVAGSKLAQKHMNEVMTACQIADGLDGDKRFDPRVNKVLRKTILSARKAMIPENYIQRVIQFAQQGYTDIEFKTYDTDWDSDAYLTVAGQNSNNSVRVSNEYLQAVLDNGEWELIQRRDGDVAKRIKASDLWEKLPTQHGPVPIRVCNMIPLSMNGTPARRGGELTPLTLVQNICSSMIPLATWRHST